MKNTDIYDCFDNNLLGIYNTEFVDLYYKMGKSRIKSVQNVEELRQFLIFLLARTEDINSYLEVGCSSGGTAYLIDSFLRKINNKFMGTLAIDSINKIRDLEQYQEKFPTFRFEHVKSHKRNWDDKFYDLIFIDADHKYESVKRDYEILKDKCKYMAFHDIAFYGFRKGHEQDKWQMNKCYCGVPKWWHTVKKRYQYWEFIDHDGAHGPLGIGVIKIK